MNVLATTRILARKARRHLSGTRAAIDLASIMVGVLVIGIVGGVIAATVFAIVPWAQDEAAKQDLAAARSAQAVAKVQQDAFLNRAGLAANGLLPAKPSMDIVADAAGTCFIAASTSATGRVFYATQAGPDVVTLAEAEAQCDTGDAAAVIADPNLRMAMLYSAQKRPTDGLTNDDVAALTSLRGMVFFEDPEVEMAWMEAGYMGQDAVIRPIADLSGIERASSLTDVNLRGSQVTDLSPLYGLGLTDLDLAQTPVSDLGPLRASNQLSTLGLGGTAVVSLEPLSLLPKLTNVDLRATDVTDLRPLSGSNVTQLSITATDAIVGLDLMTSLEYLGLSSSPFSDTTLLSGLTALKTLYLNYTNVSDLTPLNGLNLDYLDVTNANVSAADVEAYKTAHPGTTVVS